MNNHSEAFVAFDSSKLRNAVAIAECGRTGEIRFLGEIENTGTATAADLEGLGEEVRRRVFENSGIVLDWEIKRVGRQLTGVSEAVS